MRRKCWLLVDEEGVGYRPREWGWLSVDQRRGVLRVGYRSKGLRYRFLATVYDCALLTAGCGMASPG